MPVDIIMPHLGAVEEESTLLSWLVEEGESVEKGQSLFEAESDKAIVQVVAIENGSIYKILVTAGEIVSAGNTVAILLKSGESSDEIQEVSNQNTESDVKVDLRTSDPVSTNEMKKSDRTKTSPLARNMAQKLGVDLGLVEGTGPGGRIIKKDVYNYYLKQSSSTHHADNSNNKIGVETNGFSAVGDNIPLDRMRRAIAEKMSNSYRSIPHINFSIDIDMSKFIEARKDLNHQAISSGDHKVSTSALLIKLVANTLQKHELLNSSMQDDSVLIHKEINIGLAVALETGLIVPVVRNADKKNIRIIANEVNELVSRARAGNFLSGDLGGGTFTISNLGPYGIHQFDAIINPPEAAILAIGSTRQQAVPLPDSQIVSRPIMTITLSADHRIIDGAVAASFLADLKTNLEKPLYSVY